MRIEALKKIALATGLLGFGTFSSAIFVPNELPPKIREISILMGLVAVGLAIGLEVFVVLALRKRRDTRNRRWIDSYPQLSRSRTGDGHDHQRQLPKPADADGGQNTSE